MLGEDTNLLNHNLQYDCVATEHPNASVKSLLYRGGSGGVGGSERAGGRMLITSTYR